MLSVISDLSFTEATPNALSCQKNSLSLNDLRLVILPY
nr:MAG TPA: hypothetical protein [Caudoviricetes sp.]